MTQVAEVFSNRYELKRSIARGGMAEVYLARDQLLDRPVAVKVLSPEFARDESFVERFRREAQSAAGLNHPNIVAIYDWGQEHGTSFIVMEYVHGRSLREILQVNGPLKPRQVAQIGADIASGLGFAHRNGVVHRDIKPGNVLLTADREVKVADFGIAHADTGEALTQTGAVMGTATYFSPEQAQGHHVDGRSDLYSLGVVLYEMITGTPPFSGESPVAVAYKHVREEPTPPSARVAEPVPSDLEHIILTAMEKDPDARYQTGDALRTDLLRFTRGEPPVSGPVTGVITDLTGTTRTVSRGGAATAETQVTPAVGLGGGGDGYDAGGRRGGGGSGGSGSGRSRPRDDRRRTGTIIATLVGVAVLIGVIVALILTTDIGGGDGNSAEFVAVDGVIGRPFNEAEFILKAKGFKVQRRVEESNQPPDVVLDQDPSEGENLEKGKTVRLTVSNTTFRMPELAGKQRSDAVNELLRLGLTNTTTNVVTEEQDSDQAPGTVISTDPPAGETVDKSGQQVKLILAREPPIPVPNVENLPADVALSLLTGPDTGFQVTTVSEASDTIEAGRVIRTDPAIGTPIPRDSALTMFVSTGPEGVPVPNVVNQPEAQAVAALNQAGFQVFRAEQLVNNPINNGRVVATNPGADARAPRGSSVTITVGVFEPGGNNNPGGGGGGNSGPGGGGGGD